VVDAQIVDIGVVRDALTGEILAEIVAVGTNGLRQLLQRKVVLQVKLGSIAMLFQQEARLGRRVFRAPVVEKVVVVAGEVVLTYAAQEDERQFIEIIFVLLDAYRLWGLR
jgi:hypothetical protein